MNLVILDRDGVINEDSDDFIKSPAEWRPIPGSLEAIVRLKHAGLTVMVASNQSGLARGLFDYDGLFAVHDKMTRMLADLGTHVDGIFFCPHGPDDGCGCRKPQIGLFEDMGRRLGRTIRGAPFVGDSVTDVEAARAAGLHPIFVETGKRVDTDAPALADVESHTDLAAAADALIAARKNRRRRQ
ncbi:D,D-heptose 1,7-bisphosphate phosphatase [Salinisphaera orenii MK-B5]|uniref:D,D-heptose 1,7-bisphosphate phosphatase n=2 Tax=Salinisphaera orenii TaxID=856731 RepID=A0A423PEH7_9GAMM|nr:MULTISPECIES: D-glycero-beta-D-manno-heptose 1,7-bisphosphate 7-phosphatase [Salinisphaera]ROO24002.1 D,D-heptose 1,7-bisphosphate phosphatase [Salinisphaera orenii MK-B5]ROO25726.1 D,D-heptose 1,7-bisphosphate phosphatase [Salinisphaera halophila YIM 95161]